MTKEDMDKLKLCYVRGNWAWFTTQDLSKQWGDDWDDAPYEHNAGTPYEYNEHDLKKRKEAWDIVKIAYECDGFEEPCSGFSNSPYSVEDINTFNVTIGWLRNETTLVNMRAGTLFKDFVDTIINHGGVVYLPCKRGTR